MSKGFLSSLINKYAVTPILATTASQIKALISISVPVATLNAYHNQHRKSKASKG
ncbi:hypothetical protein [Dyadobacter sp. LHD-138]|uniref:hypothetical protein n=1 Tax=Dyadobacter sp. LHD-138 TaxID=3071413 RepID=UPI0027E1EE98|nr:hypothetical protein [Dyadobacter sp. LHD-138]MDQ6479830.1 hypothetical protein [Dyadobacter sp. LHD-138]